MGGYEARGGLGVLGNGQVLSGAQWANQAVAAANRFEVQGTPGTVSAFIGR